MKKKLILTFGCVAVAVVAMIVSLCFLFLGNQVIRDVPTSVRVENFEGDWQLVTDYKEGCQYEFKIEQMIGGQYLLIATVKSPQNSINLSQQSLSVLAGEKYRFSACYATENGAGNSDFCDAVEWQPSWELQMVDYASLQFENSKLSWNAVAGADFYEVRTTDLNGRETRKIAYLPRVDFDVEAGIYQVFVVAKSNNEALLDSFAGKGKEFVVEKQNQISVAQIKANGDLRVVCSEQVEVFQVFVDGDLFVQLQGQAKSYVGKFEYTFSEIELFFGDIDFENSKVLIKSLEKGCVLESEFVEIEE